MTDRPADEHRPGPLNAQLDTNPRRALKRLRSMNLRQRNDTIWGILVGMEAPAFGSALSFLVWGPFIWNVISTAIGRYPVRWNRYAVICSVAAAAYAVVKLGFTVAHSGLDSWRHWPNFVIFFAPAFYLFRLRLSDSRALFDIVIMGAGFSVILAAPLAAFEVLWLDRRAEAFCGNPNIFAMMSALFGSLGTLNVLAGSRKRRWLGVIAYLAMVFCVLVSGRRMMWIAIPFLTGIIIWAAAQYAPQKLIRRGAAGVLGVVLVGVLLASGPIWDRFSGVAEELERIEQAEDYDSSTGYRILMLRGAWSAVLDAPFAGYGVERRMDAVRAAIPEKYWHFTMYTHPHNAYLAAVLDAGILGLVVLLALLAAPVALAALAPRDEMWQLRIAVAMILTLCYAVSGIGGIMFEHDLMNSAFIAVLTIITASINDRQPAQRQAPKRRPEKT